MNETYYILNPDGTIKAFSCDRFYRYRTFKDQIGAPVLETVRTIFRDLVMIVDDDGAGRLPINLLASKLYHGYLFGENAIYGSAILAMYERNSSSGDLEWAPLNNGALVTICHLLGITSIN